MTGNAIGHLITFGKYEDALSVMFTQECIKGCQFSFATPDDVEQTLLCEDGLPGLRIERRESHKFLMPSCSMTVP